MNEYVKKIQDELSGNLPFRIRDDLYTLIIGLGGSGVKFAGETKELLLQRYGETEVTEKLDFLCLDTCDDSRPVNMSDNEYLLISGLHGSENGQKNLCYYHVRHSEGKDFDIRPHLNDLV